MGRYETAHLGRKNEKEARILNGKRLQRSKVQIGICILVRNLQKGWHPVPVSKQETYCLLLGKMNGKVESWDFGSYKRLARHRLGT